MLSGVTVGEVKALPMLSGLGAQVFSITNLLEMIEGRINNCQGFRSYRFPLALYGLFLGDLYDMILRLG